MLFQVGGHQLIKSSIDGKYIYKPTKRREVQFYETYLNRYPELKQFTCEYIGSGTLNTISHMFSDKDKALILAKEYTHYIKLENLIPVNFFKQQTNLVLDIKLGSIHHKSTASSDRHLQQLIKNSNSIMGKYLFRIDGYNRNNVLYKKEDCREMTIDNVKEILSCVAHYKELLEWLIKLYDVLDSLPICMYGPSVFIVETIDSICITLIDFSTYEDFKNIDIRWHSDILLSIQSLKKQFGTDSRSSQNAPN